MQQGKAGTPIVLYVFDVLEIEGEPVDRPAADRAPRAARGAARPAQPRRSASRRPSTTARRCFHAAEEQELEGIVAKRAESRYLPGKRSRDWLKIKTHGRQEFVIAGYTRGQGRRASGFGSLVLGVYEERRAALRRERRHRLRRGGDPAAARRSCARSSGRDSPFREVPKMPRVRRDAVVWVEPKLVAEVSFGEWTHDGRLRQPVYQGLREDKSPREVRQELPIEDEIRSGKRVC